MGQFKLTAGQKFGRNGIEGERGEEFIKLIYESKGYDVKLLPMDTEWQGKGVDMILTKDGVSKYHDSKNNLKYDKFGKKYICVEIYTNGWVFGAEKITDILTHNNPDTKETAEYSRLEMLEYLKTIGYPLEPGKADKEFIRMYEKDGPWHTPNNVSVKAPSFIQWNTHTI